MRNAIQLDFAGGRRAASLPGIALLAMGIGAVAAVAIEYRMIGEHRAGLELRLAALTRAKAPVADEHQMAAQARATVSTQQAALDLATPWTLLLSELEKAGSDSLGQVAMLAVEPDHATHHVRVSAEARTLALALAYVQRLQSSQSIRFPMLDRHEIRADDAQHPVRFELTGEWRDLP